MGIADIIAAEDRVEVKASAYYAMVREAAKCELLMNAVRCDVPHRYIREMESGEKEEDVPLIDIDLVMDRVERGAWREIDAAREGEGDDGIGETGGVQEEQTDPAGHDRTEQTGEDAQ